MKSLVSTLLGVGLLLGALAVAPLANAQNGHVVVPDSSIERPWDVGLSAHTNHLMFVRPQFGTAGPTGETPASIASVYQLTGTLGGVGTIAIVDAYHYPTSLNDFNVFSSTFGLPQETSTNPTSSTNAVFQVVYAGGGKPRTDGGWSQEAALDIEWAHAMAPTAKIVLVEAKTNSFANLFAAVDVASKLPNVRAISMSWGGSEFSGETSYDSHFPANGILYFASSGDTGGVTIYPGVSPNVISAGGTRINRDGAGNFLSETGWSGSGGGRSQYEAIPSFQSVISGIVGNSRGVPDISFDADPNTGVSVYDSTSYNGSVGWLVFGGTSVSSPSLAGIITSAGGNTSTNAELVQLYSGLGNSSVFRDIVSGTAGSFSCVTGWDFITGMGSCLTLYGK